MKKLVNLLAIAVLFSATSFAQTGSLEEVLNWLEAECAEDTTGLAEYCDLLELAIACGEGDALACLELEAGVDALMGGDESTDEGENDEGDDFEEFNEWLSWIESMCEEDPESEVCALIATATACMEGDSVACEELESLIDGMDWEWDDDDYEGGNGNGGNGGNGDWDDDDDDWGDWDDDDYEGGNGNGGNGGNGDWDDDDDDWGDWDDDDYEGGDGNGGNGDWDDDDDNGWDVEGWLMYLEMECAEDSTSIACEVLVLAEACLDGDSLACYELEELLDEMEWDEDDYEGGDGDWDDDDWGDWDDDEDGDDDDDYEGGNGGDCDDDEDGDDDESDDDEDNENEDESDGDDDGDEEDGDDASNDAECNAMFEVTQAMTEDSMPIAGSVWIYIYDFDESLSYAWDFGDEGTSEDPFPTWTYSTDGPYTICLTVSDPLGSCSDTYCESISVDSLGMLGGFMSGFTITVFDGGQGAGTPAAIAEEAPVLDEMVVYPNPNAEAFVRIRWNALQSGDVTATLFDLRGAIAADMQTTAWAGENQLELNIAGMERGYYLVQLAMGETRVTQRLIIQ